MPPRRGPDTRPPAGPSTRINDAIRAESVRLIDADGENRGVVSLAQAQEIAYMQELLAAKGGEPVPETPAGAESEHDH